MRAHALYAISPRGADLIAIIARAINYAGRACVCAYYSGVVECVIFVGGKGESWETSSYVRVE